MSDAADDLFRREDLDQRLISPKSNELAEEMQRRSAESEGAIGFKTAQSGNSAGYLPRLFDFHEKLVDEWAERLYAAYCETWSQQNRTISPEFIRAVRDRPVAQLIAAQKSSLQAQVCLRGMRIGEQPNPTALEEWDRRMDRLATRWNSKLEADAVACEYRVSKNRQISNSPRADSAKEAATDLPDLLNESAGMQSPGDRPDRMVKTEKLPTTAEAVSKQLLTEVNSLFKKFRMRRFENVEDLAEADEWQRLNHLFRGVGEKYAKASLPEERGRLVWTRENIESDRQAIHQQHAQHFCLLQSRRSDLGIDNVLRVFETKLDFAMSEGMCEAAVCIDGSELPSLTFKGQTPIEDVPQGGLRSPIGSTFAQGKQSSQDDAGQSTLTVRSYGFIRKGDVWSVTFQGRKSYFRHQIGLLYVAQLLDKPSRELAAVEIRASGAQPPEARESNTMSEAPISDASLPQELSDTTALQQYHDKLSVLDREIDLAHANNDLGTSERLQIERDQILEHLKSDIGLAGRSRVFSNERERARKSVSSAIDKAIGAIKDQDPILAEHLRNNIKTGYKFSYRDTHTPWQVCLR
jgi:hypothetical protein